ncbi:MAG: hypothetical protein R2748_13050 [Bryobacterales bacterium]
MSRSIFAPLALIALGALLLAGNLIDGFSPWTPLLDGWPWFLVAWGGYHVVRQIVARAQGDPAPRRLGAGAVLVALLAASAGVAGRKIRENDGVLFRGFGVRVQVRDPAFRAPAPPTHKSP